MTTTHKHTARLNGRTLYDILPKHGETIDGSPLYPNFHDAFGNVGYTVAHSVNVTDGVLQVIANGEQGHYEWIWFRDSGEALYTQSGWGGICFALQDGIDHALSEWGPAHRLRKHEENIQHLLASLPEDFVVRVREGGGSEDLASSLAVSVLKLFEGLKGSRQGQTDARQALDRLTEAAKQALHEMRHTTAPRDSFTNVVELLDTLVG